MATDSVSVVIPAYNAERFIAEAIESVLDQDTAPREVIVVVDGATDNTAALVEAYGRHVTGIHQSNSGVSAARNRGVAAASGSYVAFLDADDVWLPRKLGRQLEIMRDRPDLGLVYSGYQIAGPSLDTSVSETQFVHPTEAVRNTLLLEPPGIWVSSTCLIPKSVLEAVGGFDARLSTSADTDLAVRIGLRYQVDGAPEALAVYRQHESQMHHNADAMAHDMEIVYRNIFDSGDFESFSGLKRRAWANLHSTLALSYASEGRYRDAAGRAWRALCQHPTRASGLALAAGARKFASQRRRASRS